MARVLALVLFLAALPTFATTERVHPTERDRIVEAVDALGSSSESKVEAARAFLIEAGDKALAFLLDALEISGSEPIRVEAATVLGELRNEGALTPLFVASQVDPSPRVRMAAELALERLIADLNTPRPEDVRTRDYEKVTRGTIIELKKRLKSDPDPSVRAHAARSLGIYGEERDLEFLYGRAKRDKTAAVRAACFEAIRRLTYPIVLARDFRSLSRDPAQRPRNPIAVSATKAMLSLFDDENDTEVRVAIVENLTECVYPIFLLGERRFRSRARPGGSAGAFDDHRWVIEEVTDEFTRDLEQADSFDLKRAEITALVWLLSAYYRVGDVQLHDEIRRRLTREVRRGFLLGTSGYRDLLIQVRVDRHYRTSPPDNDKLAKRVTDVLKEIYLNDSNWRVRALAAEGIGLFGGRSDSIALAKGLKNETNAEVWEATIIALGRLDKASSATDLLGVYLNPQAPVEVRVAAVRAICMINYPKETHRLAGLLALETDIDVLVAGIEALGFNRDDDTAQALFQFLRHAEPEARAAALEALRYNPHKGSASLIASLLLTDPDAAVRAAAAPTLTVLAGDAAAPTLTRALKDDDPGVRRAAAVELGLLKAASAVDALIAAAVGDVDADVRIEAARSLGDIRDLKAVEPLVRRAIIEDAFESRRAIYEALLAMRQPHTVIVAIWAKLPELIKDNPTVHDEFQQLLLYLREQSLGHNIQLPR